MRNTRIAFASFVVASFYLTLLISSIEHEGFISENLSVLPLIVFSIIFMITPVVFIMDLKRRLINKKINSRNIEDMKKKPLEVSFSCLL